jgi:hypothetical protein
MPTLEETDLRPSALERQGREFFELPIYTENLDEDAQMELGRIYYEALDIY